MNPHDDQAPAIPDDPKDITLRDVLIHIQHHVHRLEKKIDSDVGSVSKELKAFRQEFREHGKGVDDLDFRVQDIESEKLPARMAAAEKQLKLAA